MIDARDSQWPLAVIATRDLSELYDTRADWPSVSDFAFVFDLSPSSRASSAGEEYKKVP